MNRSFVSLVLVLFVFLVYAQTFSHVWAASNVPPNISNVQVTNVGDSSVTINWNTDIPADSLINYGLQEDYGIVRIPVADRTSHTVTIKNLEPGRTYYFRVVSADTNGNQGISANYKVLTTGTPQSGSEAGQGSQTQTQQNQTVQNQSQSQTSSQSQTVEKITQEIKQIQSQSQLQQILNQTVSAIRGITQDLTIVGPPTVVPETTSAVISWTTDRDSSSDVVFSPTSSYVPGQYQFSQSSTGGPTKKHEVQIIGLQPYAEYHFEVHSKDSYGIEGKSLDYTFTTKATLPEIRNLHIVKVEEDSATLAWDTSVPAKALIEYQDLTTGSQNSVGRPTLASTNQMRISNLTLGTRYVAFVTAENAGGDRVKSSPIMFITVKDIVPPIITNVTNESTIFPGGDSRIQTIIQWDTDEPAYCSLSYREGINGGVDPTVIKPDAVNYTQQHTEVIVDFAPATAYQFWVSCADQAENSINSENYVLFTPIQEKSIIDIIIENFQSAFGWVKNIGGKGGG